MGSLVLSIIAAIILFFNSLVGIFEPDIYSPCVPPIRYKLGSVDKKFNMTEKNLLDTIKRAEGIWENASGRDVFTYDPNGVSHEESRRATTSARIITINMIYDDRQRLNTQVKQLETQIKTENKKVEASVLDYEAKVKDFNQRSKAWSEKFHNLSIDDPDYRQKFDEVFRESEVLNREADELRKLAEALNQSTDSYNQEVGKLNRTISQLNKTLQERPEEGVYISDGDIIEIYITNSNDELIHTLAHEFGHALGINHIEDKGTIMYPFTTQIVKASPEDLTAIKAACQERERE